ncbi:hypothetical protein BDN71DRAFT_1514325 [Pleurotus eryngii]|uniref:Uncharacterized protein n=1 Tax=Pleurotus eryngii TaxID=5323 RepID=A0A9P5ZGJ8_PLEER|nr:hypothetical protein BDN71DRAFT_1514325 [Pleurotus eryngii]
MSKPTSDTRARPKEIVDAMEWLRQELRRSTAGMDRLRALEESNEALQMKINSLSALITADDAKMAREIRRLRRNRRPTDDTQARESSVVNKD